MQPPTDPHLLHRAFSDDEGEAWIQIVREYTPLIRRFAYSIGWFDQYLDDLVQEVLVILLRKRGEFAYDPRGRFRNYLYSVVRFTAYSVGRRLQRAGEQNGMSTLLDGLEQDDPTLSEAWEKEWLEWHLRRSFEFVSQSANPVHWQVFLDLTQDGADPKAVAAKHGLTLANIYQIKKRLLCAVRKRIEEQIAGEDPQEE